MDIDEKLNEFLSGCTFTWPHDNEQGFITEFKIDYLVKALLSTSIARKELAKIKIAKQLKRHRGIELYAELYFIDTHTYYSLSIPFDETFKTLYAKHLTP